MPTRFCLRKQFRNKSVARISPAFTLTGLGYNTWRSERIEQNRNLQGASFEIVLALDRCGHWRNERRCAGLAAITRPADIGGAARNIRNR